MGKKPYDKDITVHWHQSNKALTACGQPWLVFWGDTDPESYHRGQLPYGESSTTDAKVTCQTCLEARYNIKKQEMEALAERIDIFWEKKKRKVVKPKPDHNLIAKRIAAIVVSELNKHTREGK